MSSTEWGSVQSIFTIGGLFGALLAGPVATKSGRLFAMRVISFLLLLGGVCESLAPSMFFMALGRWISGAGAGASTVVCPIYIAEISPLDKRGLFGAFTQVMINSGILFSQVLGYYLSHDNLWRIILGVPSILSIIMQLGLLFSPESPMWLADNNRPRLARDILQRLRGFSADIRSETQNWNMSGEAEEECLLASPVAQTFVKESGPSFFDVIRIYRYRRAVIGVTAVMMAQQLTGINSVVMYSVSFLGTILPSAAALVTVMVSAANVVVTLVCAPLADKIGRKPCLFLSITGMGVSSVLLAFGLGHEVAPLTIVAVLVFVCSFSAGLGPVPFILASELVGPEAVGATSSWALAGNWFSTFCVAQFFPILNGVFPRGQVFWIFAIVSLLFGVFIAWWIPETKDRHDIESIWD